VLSPRARAVLRHPGIGVLLAFLFGVLLRVEYTRHFHRPQDFIASDMEIYVNLARQFAAAGGPRMPWDVTHPMGYPTLLAFLITGGGSLERAANFQIVVSCLVPLALGLLGWAAFGRRTALAAIVFGSLYFPFVEFGALFLSEIHFILWLTLGFAGLAAARNARGRGAAALLGAAGGVSLSIAMAMKSVALLAGVAFFAMDAVSILLERGATRALADRLVRWALRAGAAAAGAAPIVSLLARACTRANRGQFCITGNKVGSDFLLGHYGRVADIEWAADQGHGFRFGSPGSFLRHYDQHARVPFTMTDGAANKAEAWRWIFAHPFDALVLSLDHVYDTFFGVAMWPSYGNPSWPYAHLSQYAFVLLLCFPTVFACVRVAKRGLRAFLQSRVALMLAPVAALAVTVAIATGEVRYRIPFDIFFIAVTCAFAVGELDGEQARAV
jgi:hypothetical protein